MDRLMIATLVTVSVAAWYISYQRHLVLAYNDAMSYMNIARLVVDNQQPGLAQIGSVWPPLNHILKLPFIWSGWAWRSGFAGSIVSMASYVGTVIGVFVTGYELSKRRLAAFTAAVVTALNLNFLYLQTTPLTEPLFMVLFVWTAYALIRYLKTGDTRHMLALALLVPLQMLARYDGWFVAAIVGIILLVFELRVRKRTLAETSGNLILYATPVVFVLLLWLGWNLLLFGNPLYFISGPFSAHAQQQVIAASAGLATEGDLWRSFETYGFGVADNIGWIVLALGLAGWIVYLNARRARPLPAPGLRLAVFAMLASVIVFNVVALALGFSTMNVPELGWNPTGGLFNVRYGILGLPFAAVGAGMLAAKWRQAVFPLLAVVALQGFVTYHAVPIALRDGTVGASAFVQGSIAWQLHKDVLPGDEVLVSMAQFNPVVFASGIPLHQFIHEGVSRSWAPATRDPEFTANWILVSDKSSDPLYVKLIKDNQGKFEKYYQLVYQTDGARLYRLSNYATAR